MKAAGLALCLLCLPCLPCLSSAATALAEQPGATPDVFYDGLAGPYRLRVTVHLPDVVPGLARLELRSETPELTGLRVLALPLDSQGSAFPPTPDRATRSPGNAQDIAQDYRAQLWLMSTGSWQVRILADGSKGPGELAIPVSALPTRVIGMPPGLAAILLLLLAVLALGLVSIAAAAAREAQLEAGAAPDADRARRARRVAAIAATLVCATIYLGNLWWSASARAYARSVYKPLTMSAQVDSRLVLTLSDPGWLPSRRLDDLIADEGHRLDLVIVQTPGLQRIWHLQPDQVAPGRFEQALPAMPAGRFQLFAQVVHADGLPETLVTTLELPAATSGSLRGDASTGQALPLGAPLGAKVEAAELPGGVRLVREGGPLVAEQTEALRFRLEDKDGHPLSDLDLGAATQAVIVSDDLSLFAHLQRAGSVPTASWRLANPKAAPEAASPPSSELLFPYGFPRPGRYRIFVQLKRAGQLEIGALDVQVGERPPTAA